MSDRVHPTERTDGVRIVLTYNSDDPPEVLLTLGSKLADAAELIEMAREGIGEHPLDVEHLRRTGRRLHELHHEIWDAISELLNGEPPPRPPWEEDEP